MATGEKNRTDIKSDMDSVLVPQLQIIDHRTLTKDWADQISFSKDVKDTVAAVDVTPTVDFSAFDFIQLTLFPPGAAITINNVADGQIVYLQVNKSATNTVAFVNATDITQNKDNIDFFHGNVLYRIFNKNAILRVEALVDPIANLDDLSIALVDFDNISDHNVEFVASRDVAISNAPAELADLSLQDNKYFKSVRANDTVLDGVTYQTLKVCDTFGVYSFERYAKQDAPKFGRWMVTGNGFSITFDITTGATVLGTMKFTKMGIIITAFLDLNNIPGTIPTSDADIPVHFRPVGANAAVPDINGVFVNTDGTISRAGSLQLGTSYITYLGQTAIDL